jgi:hypothetical protein
MGFCVAKKGHFFHTHTQKGTRIHVSRSYLDCRRGDSSAALRLRAFSLEAWNGHTDPQSRAEALVEKEALEARARGFRGLSPAGL